MIRINVSESKPYYSQRNNKIRPGSSCNVESAASFITNNEKVKPFCPKSTQLGDFLMATLLGKQGYDKMFEVAESLYPDYAPNEVHSCLEWAINKVVGKSIASFKTNWSLEDLIFSLVKGKSVIVSGKFNNLHHIVSLVGFESTQESIMSATSPKDIEIAKVKKFIIDDPWGKAESGYLDHNGNDIEMSYSEFINTLKPQGLLSKWGHLHTSVVNDINLRRE